MPVHLPAQGVLCWGHQRSLSLMLCDVSVRLQMRCCMVMPVFLRIATKGPTDITCRSTPLSEPFLFSLRKTAAAELKGLSAPAALLLKIPLRNTKRFVAIRRKMMRLFHRRLHSSEGRRTSTDAPETNDAPSSSPLSSKTFPSGIKTWYMPDHATAE